MAHNEDEVTVPLQDITSQSERHLSDSSEYTLVSPGSHEGTFSESTHGDPKTSPEPTKSLPPRLSSSYFPRRDLQNSVSSLGSSIAVTPAQAHLLNTSRTTSATVRAPFLRGISVDKSIHEELVNPPATRATSSCDPPVPTAKCLQHFAKVMARKVDPEIRAGKEARLRACLEEKKQHDDTLNQLREWVDAKSTPTTINGILAKALNLFLGPSLPIHDRLVGLAKYHYPLRRDVKLYVCDFGDGQFQKREVFFANIDEGKSVPSISYSTLIISRNVQEARLVNSALDVRQYDIL
jgi:hypothetical protein